MAGFASWAIYGLLIYIVAAIVYNISYIDDIESFFFSFVDTLLEHKWTIIPLLLGIVAGGYYVVVAVKWIFQMIWLVLTSWITWAVVGGGLLIFGIIKLSKYLKVRSHRKLEKTIKESLSVPIRTGAINDANFKSCKKLSKEAIEMLASIKNESEENSKAEIRRTLADMKLQIFYSASILAESGAYATEEDFMENFFSPLEKTFSDNNWNRMRCDKDESVIIEGKSLKIYHKIPKFISLLNKNNMTPIVDNLENVKDIDTTKFFGFVQDKDKLAQKTSLLKSLYNAARQEYSELSDIMKKVNYLLKYARVCAYRNIYLGAELLNVIRDNSGGAGLETAKNFIDTDLEGETIVVNDCDIKMDTAGIVLDSLSNIGNSFANNFDFVVENPKESIGIAALTAVGDLITERNRVINNNLDIQQQIVSRIPEIMDSYEAGQANTLRAIEILKAIIKANSGFTAIYAPLRKKVFEDNNLSGVTVKEMQQLARATSEYNKISKAEL